MTTLFKKLSITGGAIAVLVALIVNVGLNQNSQFEPNAAPPTGGLYTLTIDNTVEFNTGSKNAVITKEIGTTTLSILNTLSLAFSNTNRLPITFTGDVDEVSPRVRINQIQNIRSVLVVFSTTDTVQYRYTYLDIVNNIQGVGSPISVTESSTTSNTTYFTPLRTGGGVGDNSYPDQLLIIFPPVSVTLTSLTITYDC